MTELITLILDEAGPDNQFIHEGECVIVSSARFPNPADSNIVGFYGVRVKFREFPSPPSVKLYPCDLIGPQKDDDTPGWSYVINYSTNFPGHPASWSFYLLSTDGPVQRLSNLVAVPVSQPGQQYLPIPAGGAPDANRVWVSDGVGYSGHWVDPSVASGADKTFSEDFAASTMVTVEHNLGKKPAVMVVDSAGDEMDVPFTYVDLNTLVLHLKSATGGTVTCN